MASSPPCIVVCPGSGGPSLGPVNVVWPGSGGASKTTFSDVLLHAARARIATTAARAWKCFAINLDPEFVARARNLRVLIAAGDPRAGRKHAVSANDPSEYRTSQYELCQNRSFYAPIVTIGDSLLVCPRRDNLGGVRPVISAFVGEARRNAVEYTGGMGS
ncbi:hypothetical protein DVH29_06840 [Pelagibacterium lacus]|uniref:Uncharacterized protein n=1 Tax=Pelagibacterium lacus TaxID=2282655 RepID=A0A369W8C8_9HYPH|nr:hypothetical protein DVH29_06840 [Pelagibacterium lacus]